MEDAKRGVVLKECEVGAYGGCGVCLVKSARDLLAGREVGILVVHEVVEWGAIGAGVCDDPGCADVDDHSG